jgi:hypothetical protein
VKFLFVIAFIFGYSAAKIRNSFEPTKGKTLILHRINPNAPLFVLQAEGGAVVLLQRHAHLEASTVQSADYASAVVAVEIRPTDLWHNC